MSFYFFTDINDLNVQTSDGFGPAANETIGGVEYERFLVTSMHSAVIDCPAIAVCRGQILVQEQASNTDLLNIIFKPLETPISNLQKIKYVIYRGIKKESLVATNNSDLAAKTQNDLTKSIWTEFEKRNPSGSPSKKILGLDPSITSLSNNEEVEGVFLNTYPDVQFWHVKGGEIIGTFDKNNIGFEIIFDTVSFKPTLELARSHQTFIKVRTVAVTPLQKDFFEHWHDKEAILCFLDPCAFWASFVSEKLSVLVGGNMQRWQGADVYTNVLSKFVNKNYIYIDIRNEFNYSLNYFKNYGTSSIDNTTFIKVEKGSSGQATLDYYQNGWPLLIFDNSGFNSTTDNHQIISMQLPDGDGDNPEPIIYFSKAFNLPPSFPEEYIKEKKFLPLNINSNYTDEFHFAIAWINGDVVCSYNLIKYSKRFASSVLPPSQSTQIRRDNYLDAVFPMTLNFNYQNSLLKTVVFDEEIYIDTRFVHTYDAAFNLSLQVESSNITLLANPAFLNYQDNQRRPLELVSEFQKVGPSEIVNISEKVQGSIPMRKVLTLNDTEFEVLDMEASYTDRQEQAYIPNLQRLITLTLTKEQWQDIVDLSHSTFLIKYPQYVRCLNKEHYKDDNEIEYTSFEIGLSGYINNGTTIMLSNISTQINLTAYGIL